MAGLLRSWRERWRGEPTRDATSFLVSLVVHALALIVLALLIPSMPKGKGGVALVVSALSDAELAAGAQDLAVSMPSLENPAADTAAISPRPLEAALPHVSAPFTSPVTPSPTSHPSEEATAIPTDSLLLRSNVPTGGGIEGRSQAERARLAGQRGGSQASENAVELGLVWLAAHQRPDGSWSLRFDEGPCQGRCANAGTMDTSTGATALALLPFLGAGYSHQEGPYQELVNKGLYFLTSQMVETPHGGDLHENITMYAQGLAALTLCEAYAMTGDENLRPYAQKSIDFICYAQHPRGGWRYFPGQPGDTTVTGWQVMALKSARLARLHVPAATTARVQTFLDSVQDAKGAFYGYQAPDKAPGPTAVALLLRMYGGWPRDDDRLLRGVTYLSHLGPSQHDVYFNYYATQVLHHLGGNFWPPWNVRMRDYLVATQASSGHERGSWFFADKHGSVGGRLYTTAMCVMILEVYYRYLPLYGQDAVSEDF
jgi:hypothetical protein